MISWLIGHWEYPFQIMILSAIAARSFEWRKYFALRAILCLAVCFTVNAFKISFSEQFSYLNFVNVIICNAIIYIAICICYKSTIMQNMYVLSLSIAMQYVLYAITDLLNFIVIPDYNFLYMGVEKHIIYWIVFVLGYVAVWFITRKFKIIPAEVFKYYKIIFIFLFVGIGANVICSLMIFFDIYGKSGFFFAQPLLMACCLLCIWLSYELLVNSYLKQSNALQSYMLNEQKAEFEESRKNVEYLNIKCHDMKYQIRQLHDRYGSGSKELLDKLEDAISVFDGSATTGNSALDVILTEKNLYCIEHDIRIRYMIDGKLFSFMQDVDIYSLFSNAIDNAIEALEKVDEPEKKIIGITSNINGNLLVLHFENYFRGQLDIKNGLPTTTKQDKLYHGFGMKSIRMTAEKYNATVAIECKNDVFMLNILFKVAEDNKGI